MIVIADVAGQYQALLRLIDKVPKKPLLFVGDLIDRGPDSEKVIDFVMKKQHKCLMGNHEHMMLDACLSEPENRLYDSDIWYYNGGTATIASYGVANFELHKIPQKHLEYIANMPLFYEDEKFFVSHAPWDSGISLEAASVIQRAGYLNERSLLWNRHSPQERDKVQIFGHNSHWGVKYFGDKEKPWAICLDGSRDSVLTALDTDTMQIYQEPYELPKLREDFLEL